MSTNEVEVRPYGTQNQAGPIGQRNEVEVRPSGARVDAPVFVAQGQGRADPEVKPYGTQETLYKPQQQYSSTTSRQARPLDLEQLKNPLVATALGVTLALLLLSLSHVPKMVGGLFGRDHNDE